MRILIALLLSTVGTLSQINGTVQNDRTTKHITQPNGFWLAQPSDSTFSAAVRAVQTNISSGSATGAVISVNGLDGVVVLATTDISEGINLYWTAARILTATNGFINFSTASSVTNNPGFTVNLNAATATRAVYAALATNVASAVRLTNAIIDLRGSPAQTLQLLGPDGGDGYFLFWRASELELSNHVFLQSIRFGDGLQIRNDGVNTIDLAGISGTVTATAFSGSGASLTALPASSLTGTIDGARINTLLTNGYLRNVDVGAQIAGSNYLSANSNLPAAQLTGTIPKTVAGSLTNHSDVKIAGTSPNNGDLLQWDGLNWTNVGPTLVSGSVTWYNAGSQITNTANGQNFYIGTGASSGDLHMQNLSAASINLGSGSITANGGGLTALNASALSSGTVATAVLPYRAGTTNIGNLATSLLVTFTSAMADANYAVSLTFDTTLGSAVSAAATSKTASGFTVTLSGGIAGGASLDYTAWPYR